VISVDGLSFLHPGAATGFDDVSFVVPRGVTAALIGDNGVGKTTLLRILAGELDADEGVAAITGTVRYMPQEVGIGDGHLTVRQLLGSFAPAPLDGLSRRIAVAERELAEGEDAAGIELGDALSSWGDLGGYELEATWDVACREIVAAGIDAIGERPASTLSGGERKRLVLESLLRSGVEVLLLDEPDNYLDIPAKRQLEDRLQAGDQTILLVSHDRDLLSVAPSRIVTLEARGAWVHHGTFADYDDAFERRQAALGDDLQRWHDEEQRLRDLVRILKERARYSDVFAPKARAAETRWKRFRDTGPPPPPSADQTVGVKLAGSASGKRMLTLDRLEVPGLVAAFDDEIHHGERVGLIGPNGTGKTQLIRGLAGDPAARHAGTIRTGARVQAGYFAQITDHPELQGRHPLEVVEERTGNTERAMAILGRYGLAGTARQRYETLSGGQKARLEILLLELAGVNLLLLDEPTDNLDLVSCRALETALEGFRGAVLAVSHDRAFLRCFDRFLHIDVDGTVHAIADPDDAIEVLVHGIDTSVRSTRRRLSAGPVNSDAHDAWEA
jgi:ATPase subunit of ABC transporter with duplicated ATPase domains